VAIVGIMLVATFFNPSRLFAGFPIDPGKFSLSGTKIVMELLRVSGFTSASQPYEFTLVPPLRISPNPTFWS
jgi:hypothetical protein